jgi:hypothetical protein
MINLRNLLLPLALVATAAQAAPVITISYQNNLGADESVTVEDNGVGDLDLNAGSIAAFNPLTSFALDVMSGSTFGDPAIGTSTILTGPAASGRLEIIYADTGFTGGQTLNMNLDFGGTADNIGTASVTVFLTENNCLFGTVGCVAVELGSIDIDDPDTSFLADLTGDFDPSYGIATVQTYEISTTNPFFVSGDFNLTVPEPGVLGLLGLGALAFGVARRRR